MYQMAVCLRISTRFAHWQPRQGPRKSSCRWVWIHHSCEGQMSCLAVSIRWDQSRHGGLPCNAVRVANVILFGHVTMCMFDKRFLEGIGLIWNHGERVQTTVSHLSFFSSTSASSYVTLFFISCIARQATMPHSQLRHVKLDIKTFPAPLTYKAQNCWKINK